jgi:hypothetical protein
MKETGLPGGNGERIEAERRVGHDECHEAA